MSNFKRKPNHRRNKGCGLCDMNKREGNGKNRTKLKYKIDKNEPYFVDGPVAQLISNNIDKLF